MRGLAIAAFSAAARASRARARRLERGAVIPGYTSVPLGGGGFIEEPNSLLNPASAAPAEPPPAPIETVITGLEQAQKVRTLTRQLAR